MSFDLTNLNPASGDSTNNLLAKMLQRLQLNAGVQADEPSSNVAITNLPLPVQGTVSVGNFPAGFNVNNKPSAYLEDPVTGDKVRVADGHLSTLAVNFLYEVAHEGSYGEHTAYNFHVMGRRATFNSTSVLQDVGEWLLSTLDLLPELNGTEAMEIVSSNAADAHPSGNGTRSVRIRYLDTNYDRTSLDVTLNGTTPVSLGGFRALFIYGMEALTGGGSEVSVGNIDLRLNGAGAIQERISAGGNKSLTARFMVPDGYTAYCPAWQVASINTTQDARLRATVETDSRLLTTRYLFQDLQFVGAGITAQVILPWLKYPARCKIKISTLPGATGAANRIDASLDLLLVEDA
jgi:hypothetical protein